MKQIILEKGMKIQFDIDSSSCSIANIYDEPLIIMVTPYSNYTHIMTTIHGYLIQLCCDRYEIKRIGCDD